MSINQINNGDSGLTARTIINQVVTNVNNLPTTGTASYAITASYALNGGGGGGGTPGGLNTQIQFNSASTFSGSQYFTYNYQSQSLQQGSNTTASGLYSHAEGDTTQAIGEISHAEGYGNQAIGYGTHAEGDNTQAIGDASHTEGINTQTIGQGSHAEGYYAITIGNYSHAEGNHTIASGSYQHVTGQYNTHGDDTSLFIIGNGTGDGTRSDAFKVRQSGSIMLPVTSSGTPGWTGTQGEMIFGDDGSGNYVIWAYLGGNWKSGSLF